MVAPISDIAGTIGTNLDTVFGIPGLVGLILFGFFVLFVIMQGQRLDGKVLILIPAAFLAFKLFGDFGIQLFFIIGFVSIIIFLAWQKFNGR